MKAPRFYVAIGVYSLATGEIGRPFGLAYLSGHHSPRAAARRLATIIAGRGELARNVNHRINTRPEQAGRYSIIDAATGEDSALRPFRVRHGLARPA